MLVCLAGRRGKERHCWQRGKKDRRGIVGWIWMVAWEDVQWSVEYNPDHRVKGLF